jgi:hypothetical protein
VAHETVLRHEERPRPGALVQYTLTEKGLMKEEYTSGVRTHSQLIYFGDVWDTYQTRAFPQGLFWRLFAASAAWTVAAYLLVAHPVPLAFAGAALCLGWVLLAWRSRIATVRAFDYEGYELACFHGTPGAAFKSFLEAFERRLEASRYPLQSVFESLDLGSCEWRGLGRRWRCTFAYDRLIFRVRGILGHESRRYFSLSSVAAPIRLAWRVPWVGLTLCMVSGGLALALAADARGGSEALLWKAAQALVLLSLLSAAWSALALGVAVELPVGSQFARSPVLPWWQVSRRQEILRWFARLVRLADLLEEIDTDDYWAYHRAKLGLLREEGFLDSWPYRSAMARLNSQEREEMGD